MLRDDVDIELDLVKETNIQINETPQKDFVIDLWPTASIAVNTETDFDVIVDTYNMGLSDSDPSGPNRIHRAILFTKSVIGKKKTFGRSSLSIINNIQTIGTALFDPGTRNYINRPIVFGKAVSARKTTFGKLAFIIANNIQTAGGNTIGGVNLYGSNLYGAGTYGSILGPGTGVLSLPIGFGANISGAVPVKQTSIAEVSLASHSVPAVRTQHRIIIRARTTSGSTGVIKAALYEGANNRSGDLVTVPLSNSLADYGLYIPDVAAATITNYSNLSIKFWGYDSTGHPLVFEIAKIYLELPVATGGIQYGAISRPITFIKAVSGSISSKQTPIAEISLSSHGIPSERTNHSIKVRARTTSGSTGILRASLYEGAINRSGHPLGSTPLTNTFEDYTLVVADFLAAAITDYSNLSIRFWGYDFLGNPLVFQVANVYLELPTSVGNVTHYGAISRGITFTKAVSGVNSKRTTTAEISLASHGTPSERTNHTIKVRARTLSHSTGILKAELYEGATLRSGAIPLTTTPLTNSLADYSLVIPDVSAAAITSYSNLSIKFWGFDSAGNALVFEVANVYLELPTSSDITTHYGAVSRGITFTKAVSGFATHYAAISRAITFNVIISGKATIKAVVARAITFNRVVSGIISSKKTTVAEISLASHGTPSVRTNHTIKVRARTTSGSTGVLKAELYEGSTVRSGATPLATTPLTNSLVDYSLAIPDASAATITSYSNLSIKFWGYDSAGNALVFEVARIYLELPTP